MKGIAFSGGVLLDDTADMTEQTGLAVLVDGQKIADNVPGILEREDFS